MGRRVGIVGGSARRLESVRSVGVGLGLLAAATLSTGCGSGGGIGKPIAQFPSREELQDIAEREAMEATDLKGIELSEDLLRSGPLEVAIGVTHYKAPGAAWGQYAILFAVLQ